LQLNLPASPVTDFSVHGDDLVASTFGRGLWILDDITPLREVSAKTTSSPVYFFKPQKAMRIRWDNHQETPLSPEYPASLNPPDGAILDYYFKAPAKGEVSLDILDGKGNRVRHYSSKPPAQSTLVGNAPDYWFAPPAALETSPGLHRFVWDLRTEDPQTLTYGYFGGKLDYIEYTLPDHSVPGLTPRQQPPGPLVAPGSYDAVLRVDGKDYRQPLQVVLDPRVHASQEDLNAQWTLAQEIAAAMAASYRVYNDYAELQAAIEQRQAALKGNEQAKEVQESLSKLQKAAAAVGEGSREAPGIGPANRDLSRYLIMVESADLRPAASAYQAARDSCEALQKNLQAWDKLNGEDVKAVSKQLEGVDLSALPVAQPRSPGLLCSPRN